MTTATEKRVISFTVYGEPVAQGRPRAARIGGHVRMYDPHRSRAYKDFVRLVASEHAPDRLLEGPVRLQVDVFRPIPKSFSKKKTEQAEAGELRPTTKPDVSNYQKLIEDALTGVIWRDDALIVECTIRKWYSVRPRVEVQVVEC